MKSSKRKREHLLVNVNKRTNASLFQWQPYLLVNNATMYRAVLALLVPTSCNVRMSNSCAHSHRSCSTRWLWSLAVLVAVFVAVLVAVLFGDWSLSTPPPLHNKVKHMDTPPERKNCNGWSRINTFNVPNNAHLRDQEDFYQISELRKKATKKNQNQKSKSKNANSKTTKPNISS